MSDLPAAQRNALEAWSNNAIAAGWLHERDTQSLATAETASPSQLFQTSDRPLVVGFFGGTGVGKSTLLNRFAEEPVAQTGVERPTSRVITVYVHRSVSVDTLPPDFPLRKMRTALHNNDDFRHVLFIDMPDFDSVESENRALVDLWLPHLDVVLYVVSPERYRDDQGWRLLLRHASEHAWMFIMNHWDRGEPEQLSDFRTQLAAAGLDDPLIFKTDSSNAEEATLDDFAELQQALQATADRSIIKSLDELGIVARLKTQKRISDTWLARVGSEDALNTLSSLWTTYWHTSSETLKPVFQAKAHQLASYYAQQDASWLQRLRSTSVETTTALAPQLPLVEESVLTRIDNLIADFVNQQSQRLKLPILALKQAISTPCDRARRDFTQIVSDATSQSLAAPGHRLQRALHRALGSLSVLLPLAAMGWIAWRVVYAFTEGGSDPAAYLGSNFAVNACLLLGVSWLIPAFVQSKIRPSSEKAARRGIAYGYENAMVNTEQAVAQGLSTLQAETADLRDQYDALWQSLASPETGSLPATVQRMLATQISEPAQRTLDVRANTQSSTDSAPAS